MRISAASPDQGLPTWSVVSLWQHEVYLPRLNTESRLVHFRQGVKSKVRGGRIRRRLAFAKRLGDCAVRVAIDPARLSLLHICMVCFHPRVPFVERPSDSTANQGVASFESQLICSRYTILGGRSVTFQ